MKKLKKILFLSKRKLSIQLLLFQMLQTFKKTLICLQEWLKSWKIWAFANLKRAQSIWWLSAQLMQLNALHKSSLKICQRTCLYSLEKWPLWQKTSKGSQLKRMQNSKTKCKSSVKMLEPSLECFSTITNNEIRESNHFIKRYPIELIYMNLDISYKF